MAFRILQVLPLCAALAAALLGFAPAARAGAGGHDSGVFQDDVFRALADFARGLDAGGTAASERSGGPAMAFAAIDGGHGSPAATDPAFLDLVQYAQQVAPPAPGVNAAAGKKPPAKKTEAGKAPPTKAMAADAAEATFVGSQVCLGCHGAVTTVFKTTLMGRIFIQNPRTPAEKGGCETCHGPGSLHVKAGGGRGVGGIISFRPDDPARNVEENNAICLSCHQRGERTYWSGSTHETRGLACTNCHTVMRNVTPKFQLARVTEMDTCFQCHKDRRAQLMRSSHMPLREGKMTCSNCHNPHGSATEALLRENSVNDTCYKCHAEKRGPFLFEHLPVRENCDNCHEPHGSTNEALLKVSRPRLCAECHTFDHGPTIANGPGVVQAFGRSCNNCHTQVHGSNSPSGALLLR